MYKTLQTDSPPDRQADSSIPPKINFGGIKINCWGYKKINYWEYKNTKESTFDLIPFNYFFMIYMYTSIIILSPNVYQQRNKSGFNFPEFKQHQYASKVVKHRIKSRNRHFRNKNTHLICNSDYCKTAFGSHRREMQQINRLNYCILSF